MNFSFLKKKLFPLLAFFIPLAAYVYTAYPHVQTEDAGELMTAIYHLGIAHPPGYPLYLILAKLFSLLVPFGNFAWKCNVFSALCGAGTVFVVFLFLKKLTKSDKVALISSLFLAFNDIFWSQAIRTEMYTLNALLFSIILYLSYNWLVTRKKAQKTKLLYWTAFLFGLSLTNHHKMMLALIPLAIFFFYHDRTLWKQWRKLLTAFILFTLGLSLYLYLPIRSLANPVIDWGNPETIENIWAHITRQEYGGTIKVQAPLAQDPTLPTASSAVSTTEQISSSILATFSKYLNQTINSTKNYALGMMLVVAESFLFIPFLLGIFGLGYIIRNKKKPALLLSLMFIFYSLVLLGIIGIPGYDAAIKFNHRGFYIPFLIIITLSSGIGFHYLLKFYKKNALFTHLISGILILTLPVTLYAHGTKNNQNDNYLVYDTITRMLHDIEPNAVLLVAMGDNYTFPTLYRHLNEGYRSDIEILQLSGAVYDQWSSFEEVLKKFPNRPLYINTNIHMPPNLAFVGNGLSFKIISPEEYISQKEAWDAHTLKRIEQLEKHPLRSTDKENLDFMHRYIRAFQTYLLAEQTKPLNAKKAEKYEENLTTYLPDWWLIQQIAGHYYHRHRMPEQSIAALKESAKLNPRNFETFFDLGVVHLEAGKKELAQKYFVNARQLNPGSFYMSYGMLYFRDGNFEFALENLLEATKHVKKNNRTFYYIADSYLALKNCPQALEYYSAALDFTPEGQSLPQIEEKINFCLNVINQQKSLNANDSKK